MTQSCIDVINNQFSKLLCENESCQIMLQEKRREEISGKRCSNKKRCWIQGIVSGQVELVCRSTRYACNDGVN